MKALLENLRQNLFFYLGNFTLYDYIMFAIVLGIFFLLVILALLLIFKFQLFGSFLLIFAISFLFCGIFYGYNFVDSSIRKRSVEIVNIKQLQYSPILLVDLQLKNLSKKNFNICKLKITFYKNTKFLNKFSPIRVHYLDINKNILPKSIIDINTSIDNFQTEDFIIDTSSKCF